MERLGGTGTACRARSNQLKLGGAPPRQALEAAAAAGLSGAGTYFTALVVD